MQYKAINFRFLFVAVSILYYFLNGFEAADLSETFNSEIRNSTDLKPSVTIDLTDEEDSEVIIDNGSLEAFSISALIENTVLRATKNQNDTVMFELEIPNLTVTGTYQIKGTDETNGRFSGESTFSLELEGFTYNDMLLFEDGSLETRPVEDDEKINYATIHLALAKLEFESEDNSAQVIKAIENILRNYLQNVDDELLVGIANKLQTLLQKLNKSLEQL